MIRVSDRVNMYASTWMCTKIGPDPTAPVESVGSSESGHCEVLEALEL